MRNLYIKFLGGALMLAVAQNAKALETNVSSVAELQGALRYLNTPSMAKASNTLVLKAGRYDLTDLAEEFYFAGYKVMTNINNRVGVSYFTLRGETDDARDTVLFCRDGDTAGRVLFYNYAGSIRNLTVSNVVANTRGAGIYNHNGNSSCSNVIVTCCRTTAGNGGGINTGVLTDCQLLGNESQASGGGASEARLVGCLVRDNVARTGDGGGLYKGSAEDSDFIGNAALVGNGGGAALSTALTDCRLIGNSARVQGGGFYGATSNPSTYVLTDCVVSNNTLGGTFTATDKVVPGGGGVAYAKVVRGHVSMNFLSIDNQDKTLYAYGGGVHQCTVDGTTINGNAVRGTCKNTQGGGASNSTLARCEIYDNVVETLGAGVCGGSATECVISNNVSFGKNAAVRGAMLDACVVFGGAIDPQGPILNTQICGYTNGNVIVRGACVVTKEADLHVAGATHLVLSYGAFTNCLFAGNHLTTAYAALFSASKDHETILSSCTVAGNSAPNTHAGFTQANNVKFTAVNSIFSDNYTDSGNPADMNSGYPYLQFISCLIKACRNPASLDSLAYACSDCLVGVGAKFSLRGELPYLLRSSSPALGKGLYESWMASATDIRRDANFPRSVDGVVDMGCYQGCAPRSGMILLFR